MQKNLFCEAQIVGIISSDYFNAHLSVFELQGHLEKGGRALAHVSREVSGAIELAVRESPDSVEKVVRLALAEQRVDFVRVAAGRARSTSS